MIGSGVVDIDAWFDEFSQWLDRTAGINDAAEPRQPHVLEVLTDASNELYATATAASHLRRFGKRADPHFWARTEWGKWDLTYGTATAPFADWNQAARDEELFTHGVIEAKVIYSWHSPSKHAAAVSSVKAQLESRRRWMKKHAGEVPCEYLALVMVVSDGAIPEELKSLLAPSRLASAGSLSSDAIKALWPRTGQSGVSLALSLARPLGGA